MSSKLYALLLSSLLPFSVLSSPTPSINKQLRRAPTDISIPVPGHTKDVCSSFSSLNLWSGITSLQPPNAPADANSPSSPIQAYTMPDNASCELIAQFQFQNIGSNTIGNTQTIALPVGIVYILSFALKPEADHTGAPLNPGETQKRQLIPGNLRHEISRVVSIKAWVAPTPPVKGPYTKVSTAFFNDNAGQNGTMMFQMVSADGMKTMNMHFEIEFASTGSAGTIGLFSTGQGAAAQAALFPSHI